MSWQTYDDLRKDSPIGLEYGELLKTVEWRDLRHKIITRDENKCTSCKQTPTQKINGKHWKDYSPDEIEQERILALSKAAAFFGRDSSFKLKFAVPLGAPVDIPIFLHVHHKYYIFRNLPWQYSLDALTTLCNNCHSTLHQNETVPVYLDETLRKIADVAPCKRCSGAGYFPEYNHVQGGMCFECRGARYVQFIDLRY